MTTNQRFELAARYSAVLATEGEALRQRSLEVRKRAAAVCERSRAARRRLFAVIEERHLRAAIRSVGIPALSFDRRV